VEEISLILSYSFNALLKNWKVLLVYVLVVVISLALSFVPVLSFVFSFLPQLVYIQIAVYYGAPFLSELSLSKERLTEFLLSTTVQKAFLDRIEISAGIFLASFLVNIIIVVISTLLGILVALPLGLFSEDAFTGGASYELLVKLFVVFVVVVSFISLYFYAWPAVFGCAMSKNNFGDAFLSTFKILSPRFVKRTFSWSYFKLISLGYLIFSAFMLLSLFLLLSLLFSPLGGALLFFCNVLFGGVAARGYHLIRDE
jgi:hypothetical protein